MIHMEITALKMESISPINYYYIAAAGGMRTSSFIGDIALKYAALKQMGKLEYPSPSKFKPTYEELNQFDFWFTVGVNEKTSFGSGQGTTYMKNMTRNTMHGIDYNGTNKYPNAREGSNMYKNFYFQQPISPGNIFYSFMISKNKIEIPATLRVGTGKTGILKLSTINPNDMRAVLNRYTIENIMGKHLPLDNSSFMESLVLQYFLVGMYSANQIRDLYERWL